MEPLQAMKMPKALPVMASVLNDQLAVTTPGG